MLRSSVHWNLLSLANLNSLIIATRHSTNLWRFWGYPPYQVFLLKAEILKYDMQKVCSTSGTFGFRTSKTPSMFVFSIYATSHPLLRTDEKQMKNGWKYNTLKYWE